MAILPNSPSSFSGTSFVTGRSWKVSLYDSAQKDMKDMCLGVLRLFYFSSSCISGTRTTITKIPKASDPLIERTGGGKNAALCLKETICSC